jgi:hypothetical protein
MKFVHVSQGNTIVNWMPMDVASKLFKLLGDVPVETVEKMGGKLVVHLENNRNGFEILNNPVETLYAKKAAFVLLGSDALISFTCMNGDVWYAHNDPCKRKPVISPTLIVVPERDASSKVFQWLLNGDRSASSETMCAHLYPSDYPDDGISHPLDGSDLRRCRLFVEAAECEDRIREMSTASPTWKSISAHWGELCATMDHEAPDWRNKNGQLAKTSKMITDIIGEIKLTSSLRQKM